MTSDAWRLLRSIILKDRAIAKSFHTNQNIESNQAKALTISSEGSLITEHRSLNTDH
jgi:hypothetical protein